MKIAQCTQIIKNLFWQLSHQSGIGQFFLKSMLVALPLMIFCSTTEPSYDFPPRKYRRVLTGLEQFARNGAIKYKGKHAALVANHSSVTADFRHLIDVARSNDIIIDFVLSPEHGPFGERNNYDNHVYEIFEGKNLIVYHLHHFTSTSLKTLLEIPEIIIFDIQDMSMRCYTYVSSLKLIIDALDGTNTNLIVLDRPNPLGFLGVSGPYLDNKFFSPQVASFPATLFYEMTLGEAARYYCNEFRKNINLTVIPLANYTRDIFFHETKLPWIPPSPNLPTYRSAINYSVLVLMEGINISLGRGTSNPFEFFGAPWIDPDELCLHLSSLKIQNFKFRPVYFRPTISPYIGNLCGGAHMYYIGGIFEPLEISYAIIKMFREKYTHVTWRKNQRGFIIDELCGTDSFRKAIDSGKTYPEYKKLIEKEILNFHAKRKKYLLY